MQAFLRLLSLPDSSAATALRLGLQSLLTSLQEAARQVPTDPGAADCQGVIEELNALLQPQSGAQEGVRRLKRLREEIEGSRQLQDRLGPVRLGSAEDGALWGEVQRLFLRLSPSEAQHWSRRALQLAQQDGAAAGSSTPVRLFDESEGEVYSGLEGQIEARGLTLSPTAPLHPLLGETESAVASCQLSVASEGPSELTTDNRQLTTAAAGDVSFCLYFLEVDASLHHCLESLRPPGIHRLRDGYREAYTRELLGRFHRLRQTEDNPVEFLRSAIAVDEAIQSLLYLPLADRLSWQQQRRQRARMRLEQAAERARQAGHKVHLRWLTGSYRQVKRFSQNDWGLEFGDLGDGKTAAPPGEVLACLRVYAEIDGQAFPGRVIYRDA